MSLKLNTTAIKDYHQYGCERQVRHLMMDRQELEGLVVRAPPAPAGPWAKEAEAFEQRVIDWHDEREPVRRASRAERFLAFLAKGEVAE